MGKKRVETHRAQTTVLEDIKDTIKIAVHPGHIEGKIHKGP